MSSSDQHFPHWTNKPWTHMHGYSLQGSRLATSSLHNFFQMQFLPNAPHTGSHPHPVTPTPTPSCRTAQELEAEPSSRSCARRTCSCSPRGTRTTPRSPGSERQKTAPTDGPIEAYRIHAVGEMTPWSETKEDMIQEKTYYCKNR